jgi:AhpD family alkylhydroperoxidase
VQSETLHPVCNERRASRQIRAPREVTMMEPFLDPKTQLLVALGAAVAARCQHCFETLYGAADKVGASDQEIGAVVAIAAKVSAKSQEFMAAFIDQTTKGAVKASGAEQASTGCGCA